MFKLANYTSLYRAKLISGAYRKWLRSGDRALDVGCGNGVVTDYLSKNFNLKILGTDIRNYLVRDIDFAPMPSAGKLPISGKKFDVIMFNDVLHHTSFTNQESLLIDALSKGKTVLIFEIQPTLAGKFADFLINKIHSPEMNIPFTFRTKKEWQKIFKKLGVSYKVVAVKKPFFYPFSHIAFILNP